LGSLPPGKRRVRSGSRYLPFSPYQPQYDTPHPQGVTDGVGVSVGSGVEVGVGVSEGVSVEVSVGLSVGEGVSVGVSVGLGVAVDVGLGVEVPVGVGVGNRERTTVSVVKSSHLSPHRVDKYISKERS